MYPEEVEGVLNADPRVRMSLVRPKRNPITGAIVVAEVVLEDSVSATLDAAQIERLKNDLLEACRRALPAHKVPARLSFVPALQLSAAGKLVRPRSSLEHPPIERAGHRRQPGLGPRDDAHVGGERLSRDCRRAQDERGARSRGRAPRRDAHRGAIEFRACDLSDVAQIKPLVRAVRADFGPIYGLINNAGLGTAACWAPCATPRSSG